MNDSISVARPEAITPQWMTAALAARGIRAKVRSLTSKAVGTGQLGETRRFQLSYEGPVPADAPVTLIGKFPSADPVSAQTGHDLGIYRTEVMFYRELASRTKMRTPRALVSQINDDDQFVLLFEDLSPAKQGDQMKGCSVQDARKVLQEAVLLHSAFWNDDSLMNKSWLQVPEGAQSFYTTDLIERSWHHVQQNYTGALTSDVEQVCDRFARNHAWWNRPRGRPKHFSHNDYRVDNMMFGGRDGRVAIVDWQTAGYLGAGMDVSYFLGGALDRETRKRHEQTLLREYYNGLLENGVRDYSFETLQRDYAHYCFAAIAVAIAATLIVKRTDRGDQMLMQMVTSAALQALDNHALDDLPA